MSNTPPSTFSHLDKWEDDFICMRLPLMWAERRWGFLLFGSLLWGITGAALVVLVPVSIIFGIWAVFATITLKFRKVLADILRPKTLVNPGNPRPASDIAAMFCKYEANLIRGKESPLERFTLIRRMAHIEKELEEQRVFSAAICRLRREEELPNRREAILHSRLRKKRRAEGKLEGDGGGAGDGDGEQR